MHRIMSEFEGQSGKHLLVLRSSQFDQSGRRHLARVLVIPRIYPLGPGRMAACSIWSIRQRGLLRAKGAQMQEEGYALPAAASSRNNGVFRKARLTKCLDQEPGFLQRYEIGLQRTMLAIERHRQAVALDRIGVMESMKIVAFDDEVPLGSRFFEAPSRVDRMDYRQAKSPTWFQNARCFLNGSRHPVDILK